jgi:prepilin-type N-terminal cleavage/methylation domain-containing protein
VIERAYISGRKRFGFTLIELLSVIAIIGIFAGLIGLAFRGGGDSTVGLQASQSTIVSMMTLARGQAAVSGRNAAFLVNNSPASERYRRYVIVVVQNESGNWVALNDGVFLPQGCYVVPQTEPSGAAIETGSNWTGLASNALQTSVSQAFVSATSENWEGVNITARGTTSNTGDIIVANGRVQAPGSSPPFVFLNPDNVRGVNVLSYGTTRLIDNRSGF